MKIRKGDRVRCSPARTGARRAPSRCAYPDEGKVIVDGVNIAKKHQKPTRATMQGGIIDKDMPMPVVERGHRVPDVRQADPVGYRFEPDGTKVRICRKCGGDI